MDAVIIGPLALPAAAFTVLVAFFSALLVNHLWQKRQGRGAVHESALWAIALVGLLGARLAFLWQYHDQFAGPLAMLDIRDGGWWWPGALLAVPVAGYYLWRQPQTRPALLVSLACAATATLITLASLHLLRAPARPLPDTPLYTLDGSAVPLPSLVDDLTLINLWATWCPPCRREMPVLQAAQRRYPEVRMVLANQGEKPATVRHYLTEQQLQFDFLLLDPHTVLSEHAGNRGLPLTLLVDGNGNELARHFGPLSAASLHQLLEPHLPGEPP